MSEKPLSSAFRPTKRFLRSTDLVRDFDDPSALNGYCLTDFTQHCFTRIADGLAPSSSARSWRLTGDYGSGKSSFALLLAAGLSDGYRLPRHIQERLLPQIPRLRNVHYVPLLVTGTREAMAVAIIRALWELHQKHFSRGAKSALEERLQKLSESKVYIPDHIVVQLIQEVTTKLIANKKGTGLVLILDEVGKFLEFAALYPEKQDVFLLQKLGEYASRSGSEPFIFICLLHQGFNAYADALATGTKREWEKVAGRLEEIYFQHPLDQIVVLLASAINLDTSKIDSAQIKSIRSSMEAAIRLSWFGAAASRGTLRDYAARLYPLDPFVLPVLVRIFQRYGQNERSIFSFLYSFEPHGFHDFAARDLKTATPFRLHHFYDYIRVNLGHRLAVASYRSHWSVIESVIDSFPASDEIDVRVMKTIGILNLLNNDDLMPTEEVLQWAIAGPDEEGKKWVNSALSRLKKAKIVFFRGEGRGFCLWPHSSVDIEARFDEAKRQIPRIGNFSKAISNLLDSRPIVARRHYIETGNLRFLRIIYCSVSEIEEHVKLDPNNADGSIIVPLCENSNEHGQAIKQAQISSMTKSADFIRLIAVPRALDRLSGIILDSLRWDWVVTNTPELNNDRYAREEVSRFRTDALNRLERGVHDLVGLSRTSGRLQLTLFSKGEKVPIHSGRDLLTFVSKCCDAAFSKAPIIHNELINRQSLSSAAAAARMRLIELMFSHANKPMLNIPEGKNPPEKSIYLSVLKKTGLHRIGPNGDWALGEPVEDGPCKVGNALREIRKHLEANADQRLSIAVLMQHLRRPPFGLRDGLIPLLLAVIAIADKRDVAVYENGTFLRDVGKDAFLRLSKNPEKFDIQYCKIEGSRAELFQQLVGLLKLPYRNEKDTELLGLVRELCDILAKLPDYTRTTNKLSKRALAVRAAILSAQEPITLIFYQLPEACGFQRFGPTTPVSTREAQSFAGVLKDAIEEIRCAYPALESRILQSLGQSFDYGQKSAEDMRRSLAERAERVSYNATEMRLKAFSMRIEDTLLTMAQWIESVGSLLGLRPPSRWKDEDENVFTNELATMSGRFKRAEAVYFASNSAKANDRAMRVALTHGDGTERHQVVFVSQEDEAALRQMKAEIGRLIAKRKQIGIAAASQVIWDELKQSSE